MSAKRTAGRLGNLAVMGGAGAGEAEEMARRVMDVHATNRAEHLRTVPVEQLARSPWQPRGEIVRDSEEFLSLVDSVRARGVLEPLLARELGSGALELLAGERRLEAAKAAGLRTVPVRVLPNLADVDAREVALVENLAREDLTAWEEAQGIAALRDALTGAGRPATVRELAKLTGRAIGGVSESLAVADRLTPAVLQSANVQSLNTLPKQALLGASRGETDAERTALLRTYAAAPAPGKAAATRAKRQRAGKLGAKLAGEPFTIKGGTDTRLVVTVRRPVAELDKEAAADLLEQLRPLVEALQERIQGQGG